MSKVDYWNKFARVLDDGSIIRLRAIKYEGELLFLTDDIAKLYGGSYANGKYGLGSFSKVLNKFSINRKYFTYAEILDNSLESSVDKNSFRQGKHFVSKQDAIKILRLSNNIQALCMFKSESKAKELCDTRNSLKLDRKEFEFYKYLEAIATEFGYSVVTQHKVLKYRIDFVLNKVGYKSVFIEYDEIHHKHQVNRDSARWKQIQKQVSTESIFVRCGEENQYSFMAKLAKYLALNNE